MSTKRKTTGGHPARRSDVRPPSPHTEATPEGLMRELTRSTAERVMYGLKVLGNLETDYPDLPHMGQTVTAYKAASLALMEALGLQEGTPPLEEMARKVINP